jgi:alpha-galactosidase
MVISNSRARASCLAAIVAGLAVIVHASAVRAPQAPGPFKTTVAATPPMGWNSWDAFGTTVTEAEVKANADYMAARLASFGWKYIVVDIQWAEPFPKTHGYRKNNQDLVMDEFGRLLPATTRFPSAANGRGFKPLADYVHGKGLKFGIHIMRGVPRLAVTRRLAVKGTPVRADEVANVNSTCPWLDDMYGVDMTKRYAQAYYDSIAELYASWDVDYIKADDMARPYTHMDEIAALAAAIKRTGRPIVLSLSPGPANIEQAEDLTRYSHLWRASDDFWDDWPALKKQFDHIRRWIPHIGPDHWPDLDMLALGRIGLRAEVGEPRWTNFTREEQTTVMTLWSILRSPLMFGGNLPDNDDWTLSLLTNPEVIAVNQRSAGNRELFVREPFIAYTAREPQSGDAYLAVFNVGDQGPAPASVTLAELGVKGRCRVRDLWARADVGTVESTVDARVKPHGAVLYRLTPLVGLTSTTSESWRGR